ncbi:MAG: Gfo/Idh/MocA family oxidoreductase [Holophagales bacterium]|jgi:predicted dehydrogenase|nr:MAG: Gfo/Idh/MocA family oxidoreductase [Holophagales bacterium]
MAPRDVIRLALVGYGRIAPRHLEVFRALGAEFVGVCNRSEEGRERAIREGGIPRAYSSIAEMITKEKPDGVVACPSFPQSYSVARELLTAGVPFLLEKPPALSLLEFEDLCALQRLTRTLVMVAFNRRHYSVVRKVQEEIAGEVVDAVLVRWSENPEAFLARGFAAEEVEKLVFANSTHGLDMATLFAGEVREPQAVAMRGVKPMTWSMGLLAKSAAGTILSFTSTWAAPGPWSVTVSVSGRAYVFAPLETCTVLEKGGKERRVLPDDDDVNFKPGFLHQAQKFLECLRAGEAAPHLALSSAGPAMRLASALFGSMNCGER